MKIGLMKNSIQEYAWGSTRAIPDLMGRKNPGGKTQAELWMGAHPKAPSLVKHQGRWVSLLELIAKNPVGVLGKKVAETFNNRLPYLFKVLAAARPLSIQAHPNAEQAHEGFKRENAQKIPLDAPRRCYRDDSHKPECICALTPFWALSRFRKISGILSYFDKLNLGQVEARLTDFKKRPNVNGLKRFYTFLMTLDSTRQKKIVSEAVEQIQRAESEDPVFKWMLRLAAEYPEDIGIFSPILLNLICLQPGQAIFLDAGVLHAYLEGTGIELMANSDNVLRGGLTPKHMDVQELLRVLKFEDHDVKLLKAEESTDHELFYACPAAEFVLSIIVLKAGELYRSPADRSIEIIICTRGAATICDLHDQSETRLHQGASAMIPAAVERYSIKGEGTFYKAGVPLPVERKSSTEVIR